SGAETAGAGTSGQGTSGAGTPRARTSRAGTSGAGTSGGRTSHVGTPHAGTASAGMSPAGLSRDATAPADGQVEPRTADADRLGALLERARDGRDAAGLNAIVAELSPLLWQVARSQGLDRDTAEDVVQTTWLSLLRHLDTIRSAGALTGWLVTVTKREAWRVRRAGRGEQQMEDWAE